MSITPLDRFIRASDALIGFEASFNDVREESHTVFALDIHGEELQNLWGTVKLTYEKCLDFLGTSKKLDQEDIEGFVYRLYVKSSRLSNIERLCHLLRKTDGEAKEIVSKYPLSDSGFTMAWDNLRAAYENPRMLVNNQLKLLFNLPKLEKETFAGLKSLQRGINSCLSALSIYNVSTENWDPMIVFICVQRLPDCTVTLWEQSIKDKFVLSVWKDLDSFLTERIQTLECLRDIREVPQSQKPATSKSATQKVRSHFTNSTSSSNSCVLCKDQNHFLRDCKRFKNLSVSERFSTVKKFHCCVNCLSRTHEVKDCKSVYSCSNCRKRHHTLLHRDILSLNDSPAFRGSSNSNTGAGSYVTSQQNSADLWKLLYPLPLRELFHQLLHIDRYITCLRIGLYF